jgi:predicted TIM-barrel fold metal-dependent hydrolase
MSGSVVVDVLSRDLVYAREFIIRHQDKILWATDEGWWSFQNRDRQMNRHYTFLEQLDLPQEVLHKLYRGNTEKIYGLKQLRP